MAGEELLQGVVGGPREARLVAFARELVATPSLSKEERLAIDLVLAELAALGYEDVNVDCYGNVTARWGPAPARLLYNGHLDTVPPAGMRDPYGATIVDGAPWGTPGPALRGRGASDMKASVAAGIHAVRFLPPGLALEAGYALLLDVREELDAYEGVPYVLERGRVQAQWAISGESSGLDVSLGHRGKVVFDIVVQGRAAHMSRPHDGVNAVYEALPLLAAIREHDRSLGSDPLFGRATSAVQHVSSQPSADVSVVPSACTIRIDRRYLPGEDPETVEREVRDLVARVGAEHGISAEVRVAGIYPLMHTPAGEPLVAAARAAVREVTGREPAVKAWDFCVTATFLNRAGIASVGIGPGDEAFAHTPDEHVPVAEIIAASRIYARMITALCG